MAKVKLNIDCFNLIVNIPQDEIVQADPAIQKLCPKKEKM